MTEQKIKEQFGMVNKEKKIAVENLTTKPDQPKLSFLQNKIVKKKVSVDSKKFENCPVCFQNYKNCPNGCFDCFEVLNETWLDHCVKKHALKMETTFSKIHSTSSYYSINFNKWHRFYINVHGQIFYLECEFHLSPDLFMINMMVGMEKFGHEYFNCKYELSWGESTKTGQLIYPNWDTWDWNDHHIFDKKLSVNPNSTFNLKIFIEETRAADASPNLGKNRRSL